MKNPDRNTVNVRGDLESFPLVQHLLEKVVVLDIHDLRTEVSRLVTELNRIADELEKSRYDNLTGLLNRGAWYEVFKSAIVDANPALKNLNLMTYSGAAEALRNVGHSDGMFALAVGDVALLKFANDPGHKYGNILLKQIVLYIKNYLIPIQGNEGHNSVWGRIGGDEFAGFFRSHSTETMADALNDFSGALECCDVAALPHFRKNRISPRFDIGMASLQEACELSADIIGAGLYEGKEAMDLLIDTFVNLSDRRAKIAKAVNHISLLRRLFQELEDAHNKDEPYYVLLPYVVVGCTKIQTKVLQWSCMDDTAFQTEVLQQVLFEAGARSFESPLEALIVKAVLAPWKEKA
jgi:GGDEF domain-containing protein